MAAGPKPVYLLAGGRSSIVRRGPDPLIQSALRLAGTGRPFVAYVGAASRDSAPFLAMIGGLLRKAGAREVKLAPLYGRRANPEVAMRTIRACDVVFMSGGDVELGMNVLNKAGIVGFLRDQYLDGKPFFGASAGSIMLAKSWVRWRDDDDESSAELFPCIGIAQVYCDTHGEEDEWAELRALTRLVSPGTVTYGIPSGAALVSNPDESVLAVGGEVQRFTRSGNSVGRIASIRG